MPDYSFSENEQAVIRALGKRGFRYARETKKAIEFRNDATGDTVMLNREHSGVALVFENELPPTVEALPEVTKLNRRASSNFLNLSESVTRNGKINHMGDQVVVESPSGLSAVLDHIGV